MLAVILDSILELFMRETIRVEFLYFDFSC